MNIRRLYSFLFYSQLIINYGVDGQYQIPNRECGYEDIESVCDEILGGVLVTPARFPYMVSLQLQKDIKNDCYYHFCGATLIAPDVALTAAHCIQRVAPVDKREGLLSQPTYAALAPQCRHLKGINRVRVAYYILHPQYTRPTLVNDLAVVKLDKPLSEIGPFARYKMEGEHLNVGTLNTNYRSLAVVGYGDTSVEESQVRDYFVRALRRANLTYIGDVPCQNMLEEMNSERKLVPDLMMCAYNETADACSGDSGGPLIVTGVGLGVGDDGNYTTDLQVGIVSWGPGGSCQHPNSQLIGVYTQLDKYAGWIDDAIKQLSSTVKPPTAQVETAENSELASQTSAEGCIARNGCPCKGFWQYQGRSYYDCENPDNSGDWCIVDLSDSCVPGGTIDPPGEFWDSCDCRTKESKNSNPMMACPSTLSDCMCQQSWSHDGLLFQGCANPDSDPSGHWCYIQGTFSECTNAQNIYPESRTVTNSQGEYLGYFDYCKPECVA